MMSNASLTGQILRFSGPKGLVTAVFRHPPILQTSSHKLSITPPPTFKPGTATPGGGFPAINAGRSVDPVRTDEAE